MYIEPIVLRFAAHYQPVGNSTSVLGAVSSWRPEAGCWVPSWERRREYFWEEGQDLSVRCDAMAALERFIQKVGWDSPF